MAAGRPCLGCWPRSGQAHRGAGRCPCRRGSRPDGAEIPAVHGAGHRRGNYGCVAGGLRMRDDVAHRWGEVEAVLALATRGASRSPDSAGRLRPAHWCRRSTKLGRRACHPSARSSAAQAIPVVGTAGLRVSCRRRASGGRDTPIYRCRSRKPADKHSRGHSANANPAVQDQLWRLQQNPASYPTRPQILRESRSQSRRQVAST